MKKIIVLLSLASLIFITTGITQASTNSGASNQIEVAGYSARPDRVIVRLQNRKKSTHSSLSRLDALFSEVGASHHETITVNPAGNTSLKSSAANKTVVLEVLTLDGTTEIKSAINRLNQSRLVMYAEPDYVLRTSILPNDPEFSQQWGLHNTGQGGQNDADIDAPEAWNNRTDSSSIITAVIDTGVDYNHEDLAANMWTNPAEIPGDNVDNDGNGYIDDVHGIDCINNDSDPMDDESHGTHVSGIIGASGNNGIGITGVNWNAKIMALKFIGADGFGDTTDAIECLAYAVNMKNNFNIDIRVTNNSWGGSGFSQALQDIIQLSADAGILFVAAAGNNFTDIDQSADYPSSYDIDNIISVASTTGDDTLSWFSNFGENTVDLGAPGSEILSTIPGNQYQNASGTSMATPFVSGAAALLWANNPGLSLSTVKNRLITLGDPVAALNGLTVSGRRLNINASMNCTPGTAVMNILTPGEQFQQLTGTAATVKAQITDCGEPVTASSVTAIPGNGDPSFQLQDDGLGVDTKAGDGIYTGVWQLQNPESDITLTVHSVSPVLSDSVSGSIINNYSVDPAHSYQWIDATTGTLLDTLSNSDDDAVTVPIGFNFEFYGMPYDNITINSNGYIEFENASLQYFNTPIPDSAVPNGFLAPYWDDLLPSASPDGKIYSLLEGTAPDRRLTIAWVNIPFYGAPVDNTVTFEATLYEASNDIIFQYGAAYPADSATIGIENQHGEFGIQYLFNGQNESGPVEIEPEQAIRFYNSDDEVAPPADNENTSYPATDNANNRVILNQLLAVSKWEHAFFRFDVNAIQAGISNAVFRVYHNGAVVPSTLYVGAVEDDNWSENSGTPAITYIHLNPEVLLDSSVVTGAGYIEFNVTEFVASQANGDGIVTLEVSSDTGQWSLLGANDSPNPPELIIETATIAPVNEMPSAFFSVTPATGMAPLEINLDASTSFDADGRIVDYSWDLGDGSTATGINVIHNYAAAGTYNIMLTVTDDAGAIDQTVSVVTVTAAETPPSGGSVTLAATDDANNRVILDGVLAVSNWEHAFFRFDMSQIQGNISNATFRVYHDGDNTPLSLQVGTVADDNWSENGDTPAVTYLNLHPEQLIASHTVTQAGYTEFNITTYVSSELLADGIVSLEVSSNQNAWSRLSSKEGAFPPELVIETQ